MTTRLMPEVGCWYRDRQDGHLFQVVALDEHDGTVEMQDLDGDIDELEMDSWFDMSLDIAAAPEDPLGPGDPLDPEEREYALAGEGWEPNLPRDLGGRAEEIDALDDGSGLDELL